MKLHARAALSGLPTWNFRDLAGDRVARTSFALGKGYPSSQAQQYVVELPDAMVSQRQLAGALPENGHASPLLVDLGVRDA